MKYMYYCPVCNKVFKAGETGRKIKCPKCAADLLDLGISDQDYAVLPAAEKEIIKQNMAAKADTDKLAKETKILEKEDKLPKETKVLENEDKLPKISEGILDTAINANESLSAAINNNRDMLSQVKNNYLKMQIQNQILAADNFVSICTMSALKNDGKIDSDEAKLLKKLEKLTDEYKKGLNKLI
ncbi:MAG: zinc-ribbon domain-containing protein [Lachnospiraceae bacterium]|nr:zinc-ribbon domain-containing protein [Lachnospiraceae bacterium]